MNCPWASAKRGPRRTGVEDNDTAGAGVIDMAKAVSRPPLEAFRFFDVAGRHQSFAKAARELGVTSGAVAHRVRTLEQYLGVELFERQSHGPALNARGQAFLIEVQHILSALDKTTERFHADATVGVLKLVAVEAFAERWLMPRLAAFRCAHPDIVIEFETDHCEVDPARRKFDVWIAFVAGVSRTVQSEVLFEETLVPVCTPPSWQRGEARATGRSARMAAALRPGLGRLLGVLVCKPGGRRAGHVPGVGLSSLLDDGPGGSRGHGRRARSLPADRALSRAPNTGGAVRTAGRGPGALLPGDRSRLRGEARSAGFPGLAPGRDARERRGRAARGAARTARRSLSDDPPRRTVAGRVYNSKNRRFVSNWRRLPISFVGHTSAHLVRQFEETVLGLYGVAPDIVVEPLVERMDMLFGNYSALVDDSVSGWLEVATGVAGAANVLPPYAKRLRDLYPRARLRVRKCAQSEGLTMLLDDEVELVSGAQNSDPDKLLEYREVLSYNIVLITSLDHPLAGCETITVQEVARWPAIVPPAGTYSRQFGEAVARQMGIDVFAVIEVGGWGVLKRYVENGLGVSAVPSICIHETDQVSVIPIEEYFPSRSFGIFSRRGKRLTPPAWELLKLMIQNLQLAGGGADACAAHACPRRASEHGARLKTSTPGKSGEKPDQRAEQNTATAGGGGVLEGPVSGMGIPCTKCFRMMRARANIGTMKMIPAAASRFQRAPSSA